MLIILTKIMFFFQSDCLEEVEFSVILASQNTLGYLGLHSLYRYRHLESD